MNEFWLEMARNVPSAMAVIATVYLFLRANEKNEQVRIDAAKERESERRNHELQMNNTWASYIKAIVEKQDETLKLVSGALKEHEDASAERYRKMNNTQELIKTITQMKADAKKE